MIYIVCCMCLNVGVYSNKFVVDCVFSVEMQPRWYKLEDVPFHSMWADDKFWFSWMLADEPFYGYFTYRGLDTIISYQLSSVSDFKSLTIPQCPSHMVNGS